MTYLITNISQTFITVNGISLAPSKSITVDELTPEIETLSDKRMLEIIPKAD